MARTTIDFGIDLGTTNSEVAVLRGIEPEMVPNGAGSAITPSAVWIDKRKHLRVGQEAKQRYEADPDNCDIEFKIRMGTGTAGKKHFLASGVEMLPEELSAEVLKSLKADARTMRGEDLRAAVITVPADFELPQTSATRKAAQLAGIEVSPLLQEPVAAAYAYGFQDESEKVYWLVLRLWRRHVRCGHCPSSRGVFGSSITPVTTISAASSSTGTSWRSG